MKRKNTLVIFILTLAPLFIRAQEWVEAGYLKSGNILTTSQGKSIEIAKVEVVAQTNAVYNLEVEDWHAYYANNILVHNADYVLDIDLGWFPDTKQVERIQAIVDELIKSKAIKGLRENTKIRIAKQSSWKGTATEANSGVFKEPPTIKLRDFNDMWLLDATSKEKIGKLAFEQIIAHEVQHLVDFSNGKERSEINAMRAEVAFGKHLKLGSEYLVRDVGSKYNNYNLSIGGGKTASICRICK